MQRIALDTILGEMHFGVLNGSQKEQNSMLLDKFLPSGGVEILDIMKP